MDAMAPSRIAIAVALAAASFVVMGAAPASAESGCEVTDATLTWGFKESFRAYIDGDIANGEWTTAGGASYATPSFGWSGGTGSYDPATGTGSVEFTGSVRFTGHDGLLDTSIADPVIRFDGGSGVLLLDVSGPTMDGTPTDLEGVEFVALPTVEVAGGGAVRTVDAATQLTADGATAFPNYAAGEAFDPISLRLPVGAQCPPERDADRSAGLALLIGGGIVLLLVAAVLVVVIVRRRRA
jgi:hypothetical protein